MKDDYRLLNNEKVGAIGFWSDGNGDGHAISIIGKDESGNFIYQSNYRQGEVEIGTFDKVQQQVKERTGLTLSKSDFKFYEKK